MAASMAYKGYPVVGVDLNPIASSLSARLEQLWSEQLQKAV